MKRILLFFVLLTSLSLVACCNDAKKCDSGSRIETILKNMHDATTNQVMVISHRGDWRNYPENSIPAIESVIEMGVDIVEIDIALTKDSVLVLSHDKTIDRCTTGRGRVSDYTYEELQKFYLKSAHGARSSFDLKIPTLREALEVCKNRVMVNIDKGYDYYDMALALTEELGVSNQVLIKGSKPLATVKEKLATHPKNMLYMPIISPANESQKAMFDEFLAGEPQLAYEICWGEMNPAVESGMKRVIESGSKLWVNTLWNSLCGGLSDDVAWATSAEEVYGKIIDMGATMIQTDRPKFLLEYLRERGLHD